MHPSSEISVVYSIKYCIQYRYARSGINPNGYTKLKKKEKKRKKDGFIMIFVYFTNSQLYLFLNTYLILALIYMIMNLLDYLIRLTIELIRCNFVFMVEENGKSRLALNSGIISIPKPGIRRNFPIPKSRY